MCGIAGFVARRRSNGAALDAQAASMAAALQTRGPDDCGTWSDAEAGIAFGHRRLSIIDLSEQGHQPMISACGRYVICFNGEIYNFQDLRTNLIARGASFRGGSDTEVLLATFCQWGVAGAIERLNGMFAFAVWDRAERILHLVRDRLGEKPLYYGWANGTFMFASELKAMRVHPDFVGDVDREALTSFVRYSYVPAPASIYKGIRKLPQGSILTLPWSALAASAQVQPSSYWSAAGTVQKALAEPFDGSEDDAADQLDGLLRDAVGRQMVADVPLGALLSGGVDSSTIAAMMQAQSLRPIRTFTVGFREKGFDESFHASAVARHLGSDHTELYLSAGDALNAVTHMPKLYDEPFADVSQIPTFLLCSLIKRHVTVALSGDGGDELFGGYTRYVRADEIWRTVNRLPVSLRKAAAALLTFPRPATWEGMAVLIPRVIRGYAAEGTVADRVQKLADVLPMPTADAMYERLVNSWDDPAAIVIGGRGDGASVVKLASGTNLPNFAARMMFLDLVSYLPDDILAKVDRASMGASLEVRVPMLDYRLVDFAWRLPLAMKVHRAQTKRVLRRVLYRYVPRELVDRQKMGFGVPIAAWLRQPLRDWAEALLDERRLREDGFFNPDPIRKRWTEHVEGRQNWQGPLWSILMFQAWLRETAVSSPV